MVTHIQSARAQVCTREHCIIFFVFFAFVRFGVVCVLAFAVQTYTYDMHPVRYCTRVGWGATLMPLATLSPNDAQQKKTNVGNSSDTGHRQNNRNVCTGLRIAKPHQDRGCSACENDTKPLLWLRELLMHTSPVCIRRTAPAHVRRT